MREEHIVHMLYMHSLLCWMSSSLYMKRGRGVKDLIITHTYMYELSSSAHRNFITDTTYY